MKNVNKERNVEGRRASRTWVGRVIGVSVFGWASAAIAADVPDGTLAAAIRSSGHACAKIVEKEAPATGPAVWQVRCNSGRFHVKQKEDSTFEVVALD